MSERITVEQNSILTRDVGVVLRGTRTRGIDDVQVEGNSANLQPGSWYLRVLVEPGENIFAVEGLSGGMVASTETVTVQVPTNQVELGQTWNVFDEWGLLLGLPRLLGERNRSYALRLTHAGENPAGSAYPRLVVGTSRAVGLEPEVDAVTFSAVRQDDGTPVGADLKLQVTHIDVRFSAREMVVSEARKIESSMGTIALLDLFPMFDKRTLKVAVVDGGELPTTSFEYDEDRHELRFNDLALRGQYVTYSYQFQIRISLFNTTLAELKTRIESFLIQGDSVVSVTVSMDDTEAASGLVFEGQQDLLLDGDFTVSWAPLSMRELIDSDYQEVWYNSDGHAYGTQVEGWARRIKDKTRSGWGDVILDKDSWEEDTHTDALPHLWDARVAFWKVSGSDVRIDSSLAWWLGERTVDGQPLERFGVLNDNWKAGIGADNDLQPIDLFPVIEG